MSIKIQQDEVNEVLKTIYDPEIPVDIYNLGLIYDISIDDDNNVKVLMTLTSPGCPVAGSLVEQVKNKIQNIPGVNSASVELVWDPPWSPDLMTDIAKLQLGYM
jgi:FeS assembly SUF system protein